MKGNGRYFRLILILVVAGIGYTLFRYNQYRDYIVAIETTPHHLKLAHFYAKNMRFPADTEEYLKFVSGDKFYNSKIEAIGCKLFYDSLRNQVVLYSPGFDLDDDSLREYYDHDDVDFLSSLYKDGDLILQVKGVTDFLSILEHEWVGLRSNQPDTTLKSTKVKLWRLSQCYLDTLKAIREVDTLIIPINEIPEYTVAWLEFRKANGSTTLKVHSVLNHSFIERVQSELLAETNRRGLLSDLDNVAIGFGINFLGPRLCLENFPFTPDDAKH